MKKLLTILFVLFSFTAMAQPCADEDTVRSNAVTLITATSARINGSISHFTGSYTTLYLQYVRVGQTDTATTSGVSPLRNLTGLQPNTQYYYYYKTICVSGTNRQLGPYYFTTAINTVVYATERSTVFPYVKVDSGFKVPRQDTSTFRAPSTGGGDIVFKTSDSTMYYYNGTRWTPMAVDSGGYLALLNNKVDSVTVDSVTNRLYYWKMGVSYGYALPLDSAYVNTSAINDSTLRFYRLNGDSTDVELRGTAGSAIDTANKWVNTIYRKTGQDSIFFNKGGIEYAIKDSTGGGGGGPTGSGTTDYLARWTSSSALGIGATRDDGSSVGVGMAPSGVTGSMSIASRLYLPYYAGTTGGIYINGLKWGKGDANGNNIIGFNSGSDSATALYNAVLGNGSGGMLNGFGNVLLGDEVAPTMAGYDGSLAGSRNIFIGYQAGKFAVKPSHNISIGTGSGQNADSALSNIWIGKGTGAGTRNSVGDVFLGSSINYTGTYNSLGFNSVVGADAFQAPTTARYNSIIGAYAGQGLTTGRENVLGGYNAGASFTDGSQNVSLGAYAAYLQSGSLNVHIGYLADAYNATAYNRKLFINTKGDGGDVALIGGDGNSGQVAINKTIAQIAADAANFQVHGTSHLDSTLIVDWKIGAGVSSPTAFIHPKAGTATAGTAPIKLNTGTALTTPEDGAIEYHGSHIYFTIGSTRYQLDQQAGTNLGNSNLTQATADAIREYNLGYFNATGNRYLALGKLNGTEKTNITISSNSSTHSGYALIQASDSTSGVAVSGFYNPNGGTILQGISISGGKGNRLTQYLDSSTLNFHTTSYLTPEKVYKFTKDSLLIKGNMGVSASSSDSVLVRGSDNVVVLRAQSDLGGGLLSETYTPTLTNVANVAASTAYSCQYSRVGTVVTVSGEVDIDPTTTITLTQLGISLPIASNLAATNELGGTSADDLGTVARVAADFTNDRAEVRMTPTDVTNRRFSFTFTYRIL